MPAQASKSGVQFYGGQEQAYSNAAFGKGGMFDQFMAGKPNAGFERAQATGLRQIQQRNAQLGLSQQPLGTRLENDYLAKSTNAAGDNFLSNFFQFGQPAGTQGTGGTPGMVGQILGKG